MSLLLRTVGIRDLALGLGTASAMQSGSTRDLHRWLGAGLLSDVLDVVAGIRSARTIGARGVISALIAAPIVLADVWALTIPRTTDVRSSADRRSEIPVNHEIE
jgi:hypothetical protein